MFRIGFDIGGTFTDLVMWREGLPVLCHKVSSTPDDPSRAVLTGLTDLAQMAGVEHCDLGELLHATTVATNAILERKGAATAIVTTKGFRDVLLLGRQKRYDVYDLYLSKPQALVRRRDVFEIAERMGTDGTTVLAPDRDEIGRLARRIAAAGYRTVGIVLLNSYADPAHERLVAACFAEQAPGLAVTISSDISPRYREYERASTTAANAYLKPIVASYLDRLTTTLAANRFPTAVSIMQSNGGLVSPALAAEFPVRIVESGPAAGVLMAAEVGRELGLTEIVTFDMGGTTAKLGAIDDGVPAISASFEVDMVRFQKGSGLPLNIASIELLEIGAGGGSIAGVASGLIRVGPTSAGAAPGPICYGRGGTQPTVTDANLVLGYIDPAYFCGGTMSLDLDAARAGIESEIATPLGVDIGRAAWGIHTIVNSDMERAVRIVSIERGRDPRAYTMIAFGGAGPLHACRLARQVGIGRVVIPAGAGVGSAIGLLRASPKTDVTLTGPLVIEGEACAEVIARFFGQLQSRAMADVVALGGEEPIVWSLAAHMRYVGQGFEIRVNLPPGAVDGDYPRRVRLAFEEAYRRTYGYDETADARIEATEWYLAGEWGSAETRMLVAPPLQTAAGEQPRMRQAYFPEAGGFTACQFVRRASLVPGRPIEGPAIIEEPEATTVILPGDRAEIHSSGHLTITIGG